MKKALLFLELILISCLVVSGYMIYKEDKGTGHSIIESKNSPDNQENSDILEKSISYCSNITEQGYYTLVKSITDYPSTCFYISSSNVILDCKDYGNWIDGISGDEENYPAILISDSNNPLYNVTIINCNITQWPFGIYSKNIHSSKDSNLSFNLLPNRNSIVCEGGSDNLYEGISVINGDGILLNHCTNNTISNSRFNSDSKEGIGLYFDVGGDNNRIINNSFQGYAVGVLMENADNNLFENDSWVDSGDIHLISWTSGGSDYNSFENCSLINGDIDLSTDYGDLHYPHDNNLFKEMKIKGNISVIEGSINNTFIDVDCEGVVSIGNKSVWINNY